MSKTVIDPAAEAAMRIPVSGGKYWALVDLEDYERVSQHQWSLGRSGSRRTLYAMRRTGDTTQMLHNFIMGTTQIDHVNHDGLDNRRENLRDGSGVKNARNTRKRRSPSSSRFKGVSWRKPDASHGAGWEANIQVDGKQKYLGKFAAEEEAAKAYDYAALRYYGEYACLNFPDDLRRVIGQRPDGRPLYAIAGGSGEPEPTIPAEAPEGVTAEEWEALGDPGKKAIIRERTRAEKAERDLAASRAKPAPPKGDSQKPAPPATKPEPQEPDVAAIVQQAVAAAIKPFQEAEQQRTAEAAAAKVRDAVIEAAKPLLHDPTDALANVDLTAVVDGEGRADAEKVKAALDKVVQAKPHLAKSTTRVAPVGIGGGGPVATPDADKVKSILAQMQSSTGIRTAPTGG